MRDIIVDKEGNIVTYVTLDNSDVNNCVLLKRSITLLFESSQGNSLVSRSLSGFLSCLLIFGD